MKSAIATLRSGPLAVRGLRLLAGGQFASTIGDSCYAVALPWLVLSNHGSAVLLGIVLACYGVPRTVLIPVGGVFADRMGPRRLMLTADSARCVLVVVLAVLAARHTASLATLGPTAALIGAGEGLFLPASFAIMPTLVDGEQLAAGNAISSAAVQVGSLIGPAIGGALVAATGASTAAFAIDAASFAISAASLALIPGRKAPVSEPKGRPEAPRRRASGKKERASEEKERESEIRSVFLQSRALQVALVVVIAANLAGGGMGEVALPSLAHAKYGAAGYGALLACIAAGAVAGTLAAARTGGLRTPAVFASGVFLLEATAMCLVPYLGGEAGAAVALLVMGACNGLGNTVFLTVAQRQVPSAVLGRVMGVIMLCAFGSFPLSVAITGVLVRHIGPTPFFPIAGGLLAIAILGGLTQRDFQRFGAVEPQPVMTS
jgi:MFS family permease